MKKQFTITVEIIDGPNNRAIRALWAMLKAMLRSWGIRCLNIGGGEDLPDNAVSAEELNAMRDRCEPS